MQQPILLTDWQRLLMGDAPLVFLLELVGRAAVVYLLLLVCMRMMGKRGAAIGLPLHGPDTGLFPALLVLLVVLAWQRGLSFWAFKSRRVETLSQGDVSILLKDGCLVFDGLGEALLSRKRVMAMLRVQGVEQLGQLRRAYLEMSGAISVIPYHTPRPGLLIIPESQREDGRYTTVPGCFTCAHCGNVMPAAQAPRAPCACCGLAHWCEAVLLSGDLPIQQNRWLASGAITICSSGSWRA